MTKDQHKEHINTRRNTTLKYRTYPLEFWWSLTPQMEFIYETLPTNILPLKDTLRPGFLNFRSSSQGLSLKPKSKAISLREVNKAGVLPWAELWLVEKQWWVKKVQNRSTGPRVYWDAAMHPAQLSLSLLIYWPTASWPLLKWGKKKSLWSPRSCQGTKMTYFTLPTASTLISRPVFCESNTIQRFFKRLLWERAVKLKV